MLTLYGQTVWLKDLNDPALAPAVYDWVEAMLAAGGVLPAPDTLADHVWQRYLAAPDHAPAFEPVLADATGSDDAFEGLDPVCLMAVDAATAKHRVEHDGRIYAFCAPSCKKLFAADPESYLTGAAARAM